MRFSVLSVFDYFHCFKAGTSQSLPNNEWFEYDVTDDNNQTFQTADTESPKVTVQRSTSVDLSQLTDQLSSQQFYTIGKYLILHKTKLL